MLIDYAKNYSIHFLIYKTHYVVVRILVANHTNLINSFSNILELTSLNKEKEETWFSFNGFVTLTRA